MNCLIVSPFENWSTGRGNRNTLLAEQLNQKGHKVEFFTTNFDHSKKQKISETQSTPEGIKITTIDVLPYKTNLSLYRLLTHLFIAIKLHVFLINKKLDCVYLSSIPPEMLSIMVKRRYSVVVDVRDIWPAALERYSGKKNGWLLKPAFIYLDLFNKLFLPRADRIVVVAESYKLWLKTYTDIDAVTIPLGFRDTRSTPKDLKSAYYFYAGGLTPQFDLSEFADFIGNELLVIAGSGPLSDHYIKIFPNINLLGSISKKECDEWMSGADTLLFPSNKYACLPNKAFDYYSTKKPILFGESISVDVQQLFNTTPSQGIQVVTNYFNENEYNDLSQMNCIAKIINEIESL